LFCDLTNANFHKYIRMKQLVEQVLTESIVRFSRLQIGHLLLNFYKKTNTHVHSFLRLLVRSLDFFCSFNRTWIFGNFICDQFLSAVVGVELLFRPNDTVNRFFRKRTNRAIGILFWGRFRLTFIAFGRSLLTTSFNYKKKQITDLSYVLIDKFGAAIFHLHHLYLTQVTCRSTLNQWLVGCDTKSIDMLSCICCVLLVHWKTVLEREWSCRCVCSFFTHQHYPMHSTRLRIC
jgi:hypothetical protein